MSLYLDDLDILIVFRLLFEIPPLDNELLFDYYLCISYGTLTLKKSTRLLFGLLYVLAPFLIYIIIKFMQRFNYLVLDLRFFKEK